MKLRTILTLIFQILVVQAGGTTCFGEKSYFPKLATNQATDLKGKTYAITYSEVLEAVFAGGKAEYVYVMRVDTTTNRTKWRRKFDSFNNSQRVTALSVNPQGTNIAVVIRDNSANKRTRVIQLQTSNGEASYKFQRWYHFGQQIGIQNEGVYFAGNGKIYLAALQDYSIRDEYAGRQLVLAINAPKMTLDWHYEQPDWYGYSSTLVYKDYGVGQPNLFIGGSNDISDGQKRWVLSITRLTEAGVSPANSVFHINQEKWQTDETKAPRIDHMHLDDTGSSEILFGSSRSHRRNQAGNEIFLWKVVLDSSHNPDPNALTVAKIKKGNIKAHGHIIGLKSTLVSGNLHFVWHNTQNDKELYYAVYNWTYQIINCSKLHEQVEFPAYAVFGGSRNEGGANGLTLYQGYIAVQMQILEKKLGGNNDMSSKVGMILSSLESDSCLKTHSTSFQLEYEDPNADMTILSSPNWQNNTSVTLERFNHRGWFKISDYGFNDIADESWCSPASGAVTVTPGSATSGVHCFNWDSKETILDFTDSTAFLDGVACTDAKPIFMYSIDMTSVNHLTPYLTIVIDQETNKIIVHGTRSNSMNEYGLIYTVTVGSFLPYPSSSSTFTFQITVNACYRRGFTSPDYPDQIYYVSDPSVTYTAPAFISNIQCVAALTYGSSHSPTMTWITGTTETLQWQTDDETQVGVYIVTVTATATVTDGCVIPDEFGTYNLVVKTACYVQAPIIDSSTSIFASPALTQNVHNPDPGSISWSDFELSLAIAGLDCGVAQFSVINQDGSAIDSAVFTASLPATLGATQTLSVQTGDRSKAGIYDLRVMAWYTLYSSVIGNKDFTIVISDTCETIPLTASTLNNVIYLIDSGSARTSSFTSFNSDPLTQYCPITYTMSVSPALPSADPNAIIMSSANREFTITSTNFPSANLYTVTTRCQTPGGIDTGKYFTFTVDLLDPCFMTIDGASSIFLSPALTQDVWDPTPSSITWSDLSIATRIPSYPCGPVQFTIVNQDDSAIDLTLFTSTLVATAGANNVLTVLQTNTRANAGTYNLKVKALFTSQPSTPGQKDFTIVITDTCETSLVLTPTSLSNEVYTIATGVKKTPIFGSFLGTPAYCPVTYSHTVSPSLLGPDSAAISLSSSNKEYTFNSSNFALKAVYTVTTICLTPGGADSGKSFQFIVDFQDPCMPMIIDSASTVFASPSLTQDVWKLFSAIAWTDSLISVTDNSFACGPVQFTIENQDGTSIDSAVFTPTLVATTGSTNTLAVQTDSSAKAKTYNLKVKTTFTNYGHTIGQKDFTIVITDLCETPIVTASSLSNSNYIIGSVALDTAAFGDFLNSPSYCPISYTHSELPVLPVADSAAITLTAGTRKYTFSSLNTAIAGTYTVTTKCLTPGGSEIFGVGKSFSFNVVFSDPCTTAKLTIDPSTLTSLSYTYVIDAAADFQNLLDAKVSSDYAGSVCPTNYEFTIKNRDGSPFDSSIFSWDAAQQKFKTQTNNIAHYSLTPIPLTAHVSYTGYADAGKLDFDVTIDVHCNSATFDNFLISDMVHSALGTSSTQIVPHVQDSVSKLAGNQNGIDHCGPRVFSITTLPSSYYNEVISYNAAIFTLTLGLVGTTDLSHIGDYNIEVQVALQNYPTVIKKLTFKASVTHCIVTSVSKTLVPNQAYNIFTPQIQFTWTNFIQMPACAYTLDYSFKIKDASSNYSNLPSFITQYANTFTVSSNIPADVGSYDIAMIGSVPVGYPAFNDDLIIKLVVSNGCLVDQVTNASPILILDLTYEMTKTGMLAWSPTWSSSVLGCPLTYNIGRMINGVEEALSAHETAALTHSTSDGSLALSSTDFTLDKEAWQIKLYKKSTYSQHANSEGMHLFTITFHDFCWDSVLAPAFFSQTEYNESMYLPFTMLFTAMVDQTNGATCGGYSYELDYFNTGPLYAGIAPSLTDFSVTSTPSITGTITSRTWIGKHPLRLKCTLGSPDASTSARGNAGLFHSVFSAPVDLILNDPCLTSIVNKDKQIVEYEITVPAGNSAEIVKVSGPNDSVSKQFGNGYNTCGDMKYELSGGNNYTDTHLQFSPTVNSGTVDELVFDMKSYPGTGKEVKYNLNMTVSLKDYPEASQAIIPIYFTNIECAPLAFSFELPEQLAYTNEIQIRTGDTFPDLLITTQQIPCEFVKNYTISLDTGLDIPDFMSFSTIQGVMKFATAEQKHIGSYNVTIKSQLETELPNIIETWFNVIVSPKSTDTKPITFRRPSFNLEDKDITFNETFIYALPIVYNFEGRKMNIKLNLHTAEAFLMYDEQTFTLSAIDNKLSKEYADVYTITVTAWLDDALNKESYSEVFKLTVIIPQSEIDRAKEEEEKLKEKEENLQTPKQDIKGNFIFSYAKIQENRFIQRTSAIPEAKNPRQPVPTIKSLSPKGVLKIAWDKIMRKPNNVNELQESFVVITDESEAERIEQERKLTQQDKLQSNDRRRLKKVREWFETEKDYLQYLLVIDALEIELIPADKESTGSIQFEWDLLTYERDQLDIQLHFDYPDQVSDDGTYDEISVTFWGTDFFKSEDGEPVRYGESITAVIQRQFDTLTANKWEKITTIVMSIFTFVFLVLVLLLLGMGGSLMPIWVFTTSFSLLVHTQLLNMQLPQECLFIMKVMLKFMRLDFIPIEGDPLEAMSIDYQPPYMFQIAGYQSVNFVTNMSYPILFALAAPLPLIVLTILKDLFVCAISSCCYGQKARADENELKKKETFCEQSWSAIIVNVYIRILWLLLLETALCCLLEVRAYWYGQITDPVSQIVALTVMTLNLLLVAFIVCKLACGIKCHKLEKNKVQDSSIALDEKGDLQALQEKPGKFHHLDQPKVDQILDAAHQQFELSEKFNSALRSKQCVNESSSEVKSLWQSMQERESDLTFQIQSKINEDERQVKLQDQIAKASKDQLENEQNEQQLEPAVLEEQYYEGGESYVHFVLQQGFYDNQRATKRTFAMSFRPQANINVKQQLAMKVAQNHMTLYLDLWVTSPALFFSLIHSLRCILFAASATLTPDIIGLQLMALQVPTMSMLVLLLRHGHYIWRDRVIHAQHLCNEICIYFGSLCIVPLTNLQSDKSHQELIGWVFLGSIAANLVGNLIVLIVIVGRRARLVQMRCQNASRALRKRVQVQHEPHSFTAQKLLRVVEDEPQSFTEQKLLMTGPLVHDTLSKIEEEAESIQSETLIHQEALLLKKRKPSIAMPELSEEENQDGTKIDDIAADSRSTPSSDHDQKPSIVNDNNMAQDFSSSEQNLTKIAEKEVTVPNSSRDIQTPEVKQETEQDSDTTTQMRLATPKITKDNLPQTTEKILSIKADLEKSEARFQKYIFGQADSPSSQASFANSSVQNEELREISINMNHQFGLESQDLNLHGPSPLPQIIDVSEANDLQISEDDDQAVESWLQCNTSSIPKHPNQQEQEQPDIAEMHEIKRYQSILVNTGPIQRLGGSHRVLLTSNKRKAKVNSSPKRAIDMLLRKIKVKPIRRQKMQSGILDILSAEQRFNRTLDDIKDQLNDQDNHDDHHEMQSALDVAENCFVHGSLQNADSILSAKQRFHKTLDDMQDSLDQDDDDDASDDHDPLSAEQRFNQTLDDIKDQLDDDDDHHEMQSALDVAENRFVHGSLRNADSVIGGESSDCGQQAWKNGKGVPILLKTQSILSEYDQ